MKNKRIVCFISSLLLVWFGGRVLAADTADINATVTVQNIAVTVSDGNIAYGVLQAGGTKDTTISGVDDSQTATNTGNVTENFNIKGYNVSTGCSWTLAATQGSEQYFHKFCTTNCDTSPTWTSLTTNYQTLATGVAVNDTTTFDLQIGVPSSTTCTSQATVTVTVQAVTN